MLAFVVHRHQPGVLGGAWWAASAPSYAVAGSPSDWIIRIVGAPSRSMVRVMGANFQYEHIDTVLL